MCVCEGLYPVASRIVNRIHPGILHRRMHRSLPSLEHLSKRQRPRLRPAMEVDDGRVRGAWEAVVPHPHDEPSAAWESLLAGCRGRLQRERLPGLAPVHVILKRLRLPRMLAHELLPLDPPDRGSTPERIGGSRRHHITIPGVPADDVRRRCARRPGLGPEKSIVPLPVALPVRQVAICLPRAMHVPVHPLTEALRIGIEVGPAGRCRQVTPVRVHFRCHFRLALQQGIRQIAGHSAHRPEVRCRRTR